MTNYEWLVKHDCMPTFVHLLMRGAIPEIQERYGLPNEYRDYIADWLEVERKTGEFVDANKAMDKVIVASAKFVETCWRIPPEEKISATQQLVSLIMKSFHELPTKSLYD